MSKSIRLSIYLSFSVFLLLLSSCGGNTSDNDTASYTRTWNEPELLEVDDTGTIHFDSCKVFVNGNGDAIAVWSQREGLRYNVWANSYSVSSGWGTAEQIESNDGSAFYPQISLDSNGNAVAVWQQIDGSYTNIWANRYEKGVGWGFAKLIETEDFGPSEGAQVIFDNNGNFIAVWAQTDSHPAKGVESVYSIWSNRYEAGNGWGQSTLIESSDLSAISPQIAVDANGNAMVVWQQKKGSFYDIWSNRYEVGTGWIGKELIEATSGDATSPQISIDASGSAIAVWSQKDVMTRVFSNRYDASVGWGTEVELETSPGVADSPQIKSSANGNSIAVWRQFNGATPYNIRTSLFVEGDGWSTPETINTSNINNAAYDPQVAVDVNGNAIVVWQQSIGPYLNALVNHFTIGSGWTVEEKLSTTNYTGAAYRPHVGLNVSGNALAVWVQNEGEGGNRDLYSVWANSYD